MADEIKDPGFAPAVTNKENGHTMSFAEPHALKKAYNTFKNSNNSILTGSKNQVLRENNGTPAISGREKFNRLSTENIKNMAKEEPGNKELATELGRRQRALDKVERNKILSEEFGIKPKQEEKQLYPWYSQRNEDSEPEFMGWYGSYDDLLSDLIDSGDSNFVGSNTTIDTIEDEGMLEGLKETSFLDDDEVEEIRNYIKRPKQIKK